MASCVQRPVDLVFLLDGSERMGLENHRHAKEFVENVARRLTLANGQSDERNARVALLQYGSQAEQKVEFGLTHNLTVISDSLAAMTYLDSSSSLGSAIIHAVNNLVMSQVRTHAHTHTQRKTHTQTKDKHRQTNVVSHTRAGIQTATHACTV